jgi:hypothetical protein
MHVYACMTFIRVCILGGSSYVPVLVHIGMRGQIIEWLNECDPNHPGIVDRFLFRPSAPNTKEFCTLHDGADASLDSVGHYSAVNQHTLPPEMLCVVLCHISP